MKCAFNHPAVPPRIYTDKSGNIRCRECNREANRRWRNGQTRADQIVQLRAQIERRDQMIAALRARLLRFGVAA